MNVLRPWLPPVLSLILLFPALAAGAKTPSPRSPVALVILDPTPRLFAALSEAWEPWTELPGVAGAPVMHPGPPARIAVPFRRAGAAWSVVETVRAGLPHGVRVSVEPPATAALPPTAPASMQLELTRERRASIVADALARGRVRLAERLRQVGAVARFELETPRPTGATFELAVRLDVREDDPRLRAQLARHIAGPRLAVHEAAPDVSAARLLADALAQAREQGEELPATLQVGGAAAARAELWGATAEQTARVIEKATPPPGVLLAAECGRAGLRRATIRALRATALLEGHERTLAIRRTGEGEATVVLDAEGLATLARLARTLRDREVFVVDGDCVRGPWPLGELVGTDGLRLPSLERTGRGRPWSFANAAAAAVRLHLKHLRR